MRDRLIFTGQLLFTLLVAAFLVVPAGLSITAGVTTNYLRGISSGFTLQWVVQVWDLYANTIGLSFLIAFATLAVTLLVGVPSAYALHVRGGRLSRIVEEIITLPLAIPGLAIALALLLTYGSFGDFRRSWRSSWSAMSSSLCPSWCAPSWRFSPPSISRRSMKAPPRSALRPGGAFAT